MSNNTGGPAFPRSESLQYSQHITGGMTLRDYFAAKAMVIIPEMTAYNMKPCEEFENYIARRAYKMADAMLKARG